MIPWARFREQFLPLAFRWILGGIFLVAAAPKILHPDKFAIDISHYRLLPYAWINRVTREQELFIGFLILQLNASYQAMKSGVFISPTGLRKDIQGVFSYPLPKMVWEKMKPLQDADFVRFIETGFFKN